jgi:hypothetical protein
MGTRIEHDGKSHPDFAPETVIKVWFRDALPTEVNAFESNGDPVYGPSTDEETGSVFVDGILRDWWIWPEGSDYWADVVAYKVLESE